MSSPRKGRKTFYNLSAHLYMHHFYIWFFYKRKGYHVDQKLDVKNRGHFRIQRPKVSQKQVPDLREQKLCSHHSLLSLGRTNIFLSFTFIDDAIQPSQGTKGA